jgi:cell wall-associated NlpC family hydrolase
MKRLLPLLGAVLLITLGFSSAAGADTFRVVTPQGSSGEGPAALAPSTAVIPFTQEQNGPMSFAALRGIWQAAGARYGIPWEVLGAINKVETNFGQNLGPSSAGAIGWMQFMPSTWARWGTDANGDGIADPNNPTDAIFSAARYLAGCGGQTDIARAVYCYNHSQRYVSDVLRLAALYGRGGGDTATGLFTVDLGPQLDSARHQITASKSKLAAARARARKLAGAERRLLRDARSTPLLSDQLAAHKHAVLMAVRRDAAEARANQLQGLLDAANTRLGSLQDRASNPMLGAGFPAFGGSPGSDSGVVSIALQYLGVPYVWAGATPSGFDCSGLVQYVFAQLGVALPHNAAAQFHDPAAVSVPRNQLQPGDLVFFNGLDHVGIYMGNGEFIDAPHTGTDVRIDSLRGGWAATHYDGAKRIVGASFDNPTGTAMFAPGDASFSSDVVYFTH